MSLIEDVDLVEMIELEDEGPVVVEGRVVCRRLKSQENKLYFRWPRQKQNGKKQYPLCAFPAFYRSYDQAGDGDLVRVAGFALCRKRHSELGVPLAEFAAEGEAPAVTVAMDAVIQAMLGPIAPVKEKNRKTINVPRAALLQAQQEASAAREDAA